MKKMGSVSQVLDFLRGGPFGGSVASDVDPKSFAHRGDRGFDAPRRALPEIVNGSRAANCEGPGTKVEDVNRLLRQHTRMKKY